METFDFGKKKLLGVVFDLSIDHDKDGNRYIDILKLKLNKKVYDSDENLLVFVSHPDNQVPRLSSQGTAQIDNYDEPLDFRLGEATKFVAHSVGDSVEDADKFIIVFTNRFNPKFKNHYRALCDIKKNKNYDYDISFVLIGDKKEYDHVKKMCDESGCKFFYVPEMKFFDEVLNQIGV